MQQEMQKEQIIEELKKMGCRITKQRAVLLDIILKEDCSCCKEIYYEAKSRQLNVGIATVYRMVNTLEQIGVIDRKKMYQVECSEKQCEKFIVKMDDGTSYCLSKNKMNDVLSEGLKSIGLMEGKKVQEVLPE
ncbi:MAG: transcriptional repressor [Hespellia sp.]|nr:transcriptional repressor [Hespellia sp.]